MKRNINKALALVLGLMMLTSMLALTSCGGNGAGSNGEVYIYCYGDYYDQAIIDQFESETGIAVIQDTYDTAEELYTVLENDSSSYDCICTSDYMIEKMIDKDMLAELNYDNIPEIKNLDEIYMQKSETFDPGNKYSVPYQVGVAGIMYNPEMVKGDVDSWDILWDKKYADQIVMPDSVRDAFQLSLKRLGYDINTQNESEIKEAAAELEKQKGLVYRYANDSARDPIADESAAIGVMWNGEYQYVTDLNDKCKFVVPKEGSEFFIDSWSVLKGAANKDNAEAWINFLCRADIAATNFEYLGYTTPNKAALDLIDADKIANPAIFPTKDIVARCDSLKTLPDEVMDIYSKYWKKVKAE